MFQFPRLPPAEVCVPKAGREPSLPGFPHSGTPGSTPACGSPGTIAACRALLRLPAPRHPPCALHALPARRGGRGHASLDEKKTFPSAMRLSRCPGGTRGAGYRGPRRGRLLPRKEVIQPHLPVRLPCYGCRRLGWCDGRCVQGPGTHSPRRADPRLLATPASRRRVAACGPNWGRLCGVRSPSRGRIPLCRPL